MRPIYVIVHMMCLEFKWAAEERVPVLTGVWNELQRIFDQEDYRMVTGSPSNVPPGINIRRPVRVCGAYYSPDGRDPRCVNTQLEALAEQGYDAELYIPATMYSARSMIEADIADFCER